MMRRIWLMAMAALACLAACGGGDAAAPSSDPALNQGALNSWTPRVAIVFPVTAAGGAKDAAYAANVSVWPTNRVLCGKEPSPDVSLYMAKDFEPGDLVQQQRAIAPRQVGGISFPSAEFNDVPANLAADASASYSFVAYVRGQPASNAWLYGKPPAQYTPVKPTGYGSPDPAALDTRIQIVFPHDESGKPAPSNTATEVNVALDIFQHGTELSVPPDAPYTPKLWLSQGSEPLATVPPGVQKTTYTLNGQGYPRWVFNNVRVDPAAGYHLLATVGLLGQRGGSYPTIWTHAPAHPAAAKPQAPPACIP
jgi:hypothetical protein